MTLIDQIKRDREAGTPGPWGLSAQGGQEGTTLTAIHGPAVLTKRGKSVVYHVAQYILPENARRIARVPDMEAALLAAEELADWVERFQDGFPVRRKHIDSFLTAYRKATGEEE